MPGEVADEQTHGGRGIATGFDTHAPRRSDHGRALQVHRTGFPIATTRAASPDLVERVAVATFDRVETQHGHPAVEQVVVLVRCRGFPG